MNIQAALQKLDENEFHNRLRNELIMLPIPKAQFFDRKVPAGVNRNDFKDLIIEKQTHILHCAISRVRIFSFMNKMFYQISKGKVQEIIKGKFKKVSL